MGTSYHKHIHLHFNLSTSMRDGDSEDIPLTEDIKNDPLFCAKGRFITHKRLPGKISTITKWRVVYKELVAQYQKFREVTKGKADYSHVDFHLWFNLTWPVSVALNIFTWKYGIKSVRYLGQHQVNSLRYKVYRALSWNPCVKSYPATNIDYYVSKKGPLITAKQSNCFAIHIIKTVFFWTTAHLI